MAYVITQNCCKDASCIPVCPVDCIRPTGGVGPTGVPDRTTMLYIDPQSCIDCGACMEECPVDAIYPDEDLPAALAPFKDINAGYFEQNPLRPDDSASPTPHQPVPPGSLRVAIVGAGPSACYAARDLLDIGGVEVDLFERLPTPFGLIRAGVAPDHQNTKSLVNIFERVFINKRFGCHLNVEIGDRITHADLMAHHHAVIYAVGASASRQLGIPGENLDGHNAAADFVGWYNGHPDHTEHQFDLTGERAVLVGNGNVALDVARILLVAADRLAATDIAQHALDTLSHSHIREVVILGRRGPRDAAFSVGEFLALGQLEGVDILIDGGDLNARPDDDVETANKLALAREYAQRVPSANKRIVFRFHTSPVELMGTDRVRALRVRCGEDIDDIDTSLVLSAIGYRGTPVSGLGFDPERGIVPNEFGRVLDEDDNPVPGVYVTGWIKRGPQGIIGTNRSCAAETLSKLLADHQDGTLTREVGDRAALQGLLSERLVTTVNWDGWRAIDAAERDRGATAERPRIKLVNVEEMLAQTGSVTRSRA